MLLNTHFDFLLFNDLLVFLKKQPLYNNKGSSLQFILRVLTLEQRTVHLFLPDPRGPGLHLAFQFSYVRSVGRSLGRSVVRL